MEKYDYINTVINDIKYFVKENYSIFELEKNEDIIETVYEEVLNDDSVTGNASGSYFCDTELAKEALNGNIDLVLEAIRYWGNDMALFDSYEVIDVNIRIMLVEFYFEKAIAELFREVGNYGEWI